MPAMPADRIGAEGDARRVGLDHALHEHGGGERRFGQTLFAPVGEDALAEAGAPDRLDLLQQAVEGDEQIAVQLSRERVLGPVFIDRGGPHRKEPRIASQAPGRGEESLGETAFEPKFRPGPGRRERLGQDDKPLRDGQGGATQPRERAGLAAQACAGRDAVMVTDQVRSHRRLGFDPKGNNAEHQVEGKGPDPRECLDPLGSLGIGGA
jgi:hypothetical protein